MDFWRFRQEKKQEQKRLRAAPLRPQDVAMGCPLARHGADHI